jgi:hypothetical protein
MLGLINHLMNNFGPGPKFIPMNININLQKGMMSIYVIALMIYFQNFS